MSKNIANRFKQHLKELEKQCHHSKKLQKDFNKYGITHFRFSVLELCNIEELEEKEKFWIARYDSIDNGYNVQDPGVESVKAALNQIIKNSRIDLIMNYFNIVGFGIPFLIGIYLMASKWFYDTAQIPLISYGSWLKLSIVVGTIISCWWIVEAIKKIKATKTKSLFAEIRQEITITNGVKDDAARQKALDYYNQTGKFPSYRQLGEMAGVSKDKAGKIIRQLKTKIS